MKKLFLVFVAIMLQSCIFNDRTDSDKNLAKQQEKLMQEANREVGMPAIKNFTQRKMMKILILLAAIHYLFMLFI